MKTKILVLALSLALPMVATAGSYGGASRHGDDSTVDIKIAQEQFGVAEGDETLASGAQSYNADIDVAGMKANISAKLELLAGGKGKSAIAGDQAASFKARIKDACRSCK